jgi:glyoxylate/hydroxypyruvate reductase
VDVLVIAPLASEHLAELARIDASLHVESAWDLFAPELVADWPAHTVDWYLPPRFKSAVDAPELRAQRDALLGAAHVICITFPYPCHVLHRAPNLRLVHQLPAGVSNLKRGDLWQAPISITSGRGAGETLPIAEWAIAAAFALSKDFPRAFSQRAEGRLDRQSMRGRQLAGKTLGVIGLGGIGQHVARLGAALGMRVVGSRHSAEPVPGVERIYTPRQLGQLLPLCDVVVLSTQLTEQTFHLMNAETLAAMRPGALLINVARGELIDEAALIQSLRAGRLGGFGADVYDGEFERQPPAALLALENVLITPHTSGQTETPSRRAFEILRENVRRLLNAEPLLNQVDWSRGY